MGGGALRCSLMLIALGLFPGRGSAVGEEEEGGGTRTMILDEADGLLAATGTRTDNGAVDEAVGPPPAKLVLGPAGGASGSGTRGATQLHFIHIPKNAGTTVEALGLKYGMPWGRYDLSGSIHYPIGLGNCVSFYHRPPVGRNSNVKTFCVHRDPFDRIVSEARYEIVWLKSNKNGVIAAHPQLQRACPSKEQFNINIRRHMHEGSQVDCHWVPQYKFLHHCDHVLRFERLHKQKVKGLNSNFLRLAEDFDALMKLYGLLARWDNTHKMDVGHILEEKDCWLGHEDLDELTQYRARTLYRADFDIHYALKDNVTLNGISNPDFKRLLNNVIRT